jgi:hypothetical protein
MPSSAGGHLATWEQPPNQASGDLGGALLLAHAGTDDQHRPGQDRDHPLQRRELPLGTGHLLGGRRIGGGAALHWDVTGRLQLLANTRA